MTPAPTKPSEALPMDYAAIGEHGVFAIMVSDIEASEIRRFKAMAKRHGARVELLTRHEASDRLKAYFIKMQRAREAFNAALAEAAGQ